MDDLAGKLQEYDKPLSSVPPLALITFAAPFAVKLETAPIFSVRAGSFLNDKLLICH